jgi:hypothetical protein
VAIKLRKQCRRIPASSFGNARDVENLSNQNRETAVFFVPMEILLVLRFKPIIPVADI